MDSMVNTELVCADSASILASLLALGASAAAVRRGHAAGIGQCSPVTLIDGCSTARA